MAMRHNLTELQEARRRLGLLALANQRPKITGHCLTGEELAALVEGRLTPEQRSARLTHLADCEHCYGQWLQLDRFWREQTIPHRPGKRLSWLAQPKHWAAAGSLLAAAASIAVFLSITERVDQQTLTQLHEKPLQEMREPAIPAPAAAPANDSISRQAEPVPSSPQPDPAQEAAQQTAAPQSQAKQEIRAPQKSKVQREAKRPTEPQPVAKARAPMEEQGPSSDSREAERQNAYQDRENAVGSRTTTSREEQRTDGNAGGFSASSREQVKKYPASALPAKPSPQSPLQEWHTQIRQGCALAPSKEFLDAVAKQGRALLDRTAPLPSAEQQHIQRVLTQLEQPFSAERQCQAIVALLPTQESKQQP